MKSLVVLNECLFSDKQKKLLNNKFTDVCFYSDTSNEKTAMKRIGGRNIVVMDQFMWTISEELFIQCKNIELIIVNTTAYDRIPIHLLKKYKVKLSNLKKYASKDVAEVAVAMMMYLNCNLDIARKIIMEEKLKIGQYKQSDLVRDIWPGHPIVPFLKRYPIFKQTAGIIGLGNIGKEIAILCKKLGMRVIAFNRTDKSIAGVLLVSLERLFKESDVIFIALKYDPNTMTKIISDSLLNLAKQDSILISVAPSQLIAVDYLIKNHTKFRGLGFDYFVTDELIKLMKLKKNNIIVTPHLGHQSHDAYSNLTNSIIEAAINFLEKRPLHLINL